jgi:hypothetical protein
MYCPEGDCTQFWYKHYFDDFCAQPVLNTTHPSTTKHEISDTAANLPTALGLAPIVSAIVSLYLMCICSLLERMWSHCHITRVQQTFATATTTRPQITAAIPLSPTVISPGGKVFGMVCEKGMRVTRGGAYSNDIWVWERKSLFMQPGGSGQHFLWAKQESDSRSAFFERVWVRERKSLLCYTTHTKMSVASEINPMVLYHCTFFPAAKKWFTPLWEWRMPRGESQI